MSYKIRNIAIVNVSAKTGGVRTFVDNFVKALNRHTNYIIELVDFKEINISQLKKYDIIHFSEIPISLLWKFLLIPSKTKKILTIHGWFKEEYLQIFHEEKNIIKKIKVLLRLVITKFLLSFKFFDLITTPSEITKRKNYLKDAMIITNAIFPSDYQNVKEINSKKTYIEFIAYSSGGGNKDLSVIPLITIFKRLASERKEKIRLSIFGKKPSDFNIEDTSNTIRYFGYVKRKKFLRHLKSADCFITLKNFSDLGYAEMEAGIMKIPILKIYTDQYEELKDGITGIIIKNHKDIYKKLSQFIKNYPKIKKDMGENLYEYIRMNKNWKNVIRVWCKVLKSLNYYNYNEN